MLCLVSQLTDQACIHTINPYGISPEQKKNQEKLKVIAASIVVGLHNFSVFTVFAISAKTGCTSAMFLRSSRCSGAGGTSNLSPSNSIATRHYSSNLSSSSSITTRHYSSKLWYCPRCSFAWYCSRCSFAWLCSRFSRFC